MSLNPFNSVMMKHPLNWLIVVAVAVLGAMFLYHAMAIPGMVRSKMNGGKGSQAPASQGSAEAGGMNDVGSFNA